MMSGSSSAWMKHIGVGGSWEERRRPLGLETSEGDLLKYYYYSALHRSTDLAFKELRVNKLEIP